MEREDQAAEILARWQQERQAGRCCRPAELIAQHPDLAHDLRDALAAQALLDEVLQAPSVPAARRMLPALERLGRYHLLRPLGRGGMGTVYEAVQEGMDRRVAVKVLDAGATPDSRALLRFQQEARATGSLQHTNIVTVHELGVDDGIWYYVMEFVPGSTLERLLAQERAGEGGSQAFGGMRRGDPAWYARVAGAFAEVADGLHLAHEDGIVHRDIKPSNLILSPEGRLKILDFGLARLADAAQSMTRSGDLIGTPLYMSPEAASGKGNDADARGDVYSLAATLYEVLTLRTPFVGRTPRETTEAILTQTAEAPRRLDARVPRDLETIVLRCLEKEPGGRYASALDLARDLRAFSEGRSIQAKRRGPFARAWRYVVRRRRMAAVVGGALLALGAAGVLGRMALEERQNRLREEGRRADLEYLNLCAMAERTFAARVPEDGGRSGADLYAAAIALRPDRPEAYLGRALWPWSDAQRALDDVAAAETRGAAPRAVHLLRAHLLQEKGNSQAAQQERQRAASHPPTDLSARFLEARLGLLGGNLTGALSLLDEVIEDAPVGGSVRYLALRNRVEALRIQGRWADVLRDVVVLRSEGSPSLHVLASEAHAWRMLGDERRADELVAGLLERARTRHALDGWLEVTGALRMAQEWASLDRAAGLGLAAFPAATALMGARMQALMQLGRETEAVAVAEEALALEPDAHEPLAVLGRVAQKHGDHAKAVEWLRRASAAGEGCWACPANLAVSLHAQGAPQEALAAAQEAVRRQPLQPDAHATRASLALDLRQWDVVREATSRALALDPRHVRSLCLRGRLKLQERRLQEAVSHFDAALAVDPRSVDALSGKGVALADLERPKEALVAFDAALALEETAFLQGRRGLALLDLDDLTRAATALRRACELDPSSGAWRVSLAFVLLLSSDFEGAKAAAEEALALDEGDALAHAHHAHALMRLRRHHQSLQSAERALALDPSLAWALWVRGWARLQADDPQAALADLRQAHAGLRGYPELPGQLGKAYERLGMRREALEAYREALDAGLRDADVANNAAWMLVIRPGASPGDLELAVRWAEQARAAQPQIAAYWNTLGVARLRAGEDRAALETLESSLTLPEGEDVISHLALCMLRLRLGEREQAEQHHRRAVALLQEKPTEDPDVAEFRTEAETALEAARR